MITKTSLILLVLCFAVISTSPVPAERIPGQEQGIQMLQQVVEKLGGGYVITYDQQKQSIQDTINSIQQMGLKGVESGIGFLKNGLEIIFLIPTFGRNIIAQG